MAGAGRQAMEPEGTANIAPAAIGRQLGLSPGRTSPAQDRRPGQALQRPAQIAAEHLGLIEAAGPAAAGVQRHGHHQLRSRPASGVDAAGHELGQHATGSQIAAELEALDQGFGGTAIGKGRKGRIEGRQSGRAATAQAHRVDPLQTTALTAGLDPVELRFASPAAVETGTAGQSADQTDGRIQPAVNLEQALQVDKSAPTSGYLPSCHANVLPLPMPTPELSIRNDWRHDEVEALFELPFADLLHRAQGLHRQHFDPNEVQVSTLLSIKTGRCPEDCKYCPQSVRWNTGLEDEDLLPLHVVRDAARRARESGAERFCMGAAWRRPKDRQLDQVIEMLKVVRDEGLETCLTLGMLTPDQAHKLRDAGLDYYNHNLDTSPEYYQEIISTRSYDDRLQTLEAVRQSGMKVCCGGIIGMGESRADRAGLIQALANLPEHPQSVPINQLVQVPGTPLDGTDPIDPLEFVRTIAVARIVLPASRVRLSAGREDMSDELQALCFLAGANSIFYGDKLLTTGNPDVERDDRLFERLGINRGKATLQSGSPETAACDRLAAGH